MYFLSLFSARSIRIFPYRFIRFVRFVFLDPLDRIGKECVRQYLLIRATIQKKWINDRQKQAFSCQLQADLRDRFLQTAGIMRVLEDQLPHDELFLNPYWCALREQQNMTIRVIKSLQF